MATSTLTPYINNTQTASFAFAQANDSVTKWLKADRPISTPYSIEQIRRYTAPGSKGNDRVILRVKRVENNATTGLPAAAQFEVVCSIPKDQTILTTAVMKEMISVAVSLVNESTAFEATTVNAGKLLSGMDL